MCEGHPRGPQSLPGRPFPTCACQAGDTRETAPSGWLSPPPWGGFWQGSVRGPHCPTCPPLQWGLTCRLSPRPLYAGGGQSGETPRAAGPRGATAGVRDTPSHPGDQPGHDKRVDLGAEYRVTRLQSRQGLGGAPWSPVLCRGSLPPPCRPWWEDSQLNDQSLCRGRLPILSNRPRSPRGTSAQGCGHHWLSVSPPLHHCPSSGSPAA